jgi:DNA invertase Pin-like site-specific DNA recombinase
MLVGYARVSTNQQNLDSQIKALRDAGCEEIFKEKKSGTTKVNRIELEEALRFVRKGDIFVVNRLDRFARSIQDINNTIKQLQEKGVGFKALEQGIDIPANGSTDSMGKLLLNILGVFAEFETDIRAERQADGIANAKAKGVKFGRNSKLSDDDIKQMIDLKETGKSVSEIVEQFNINRSSYYRLVAKYKNDNLNT